MSIRAGGFRGQIPFGGIARGAIARGGIPYRQGGTAIDPLAFHALTYDPDTYKFLPFKAGIGPATQGRSSERYALSNEGLYYSVPAYEVAINGGRVVWNQGPYSEDFSNALWVKTGATPTYSQADPNGGTTATKFVFAGATSNRVSIRGDSLAEGSLYGPRDYVFSVWLKADAPTTDVALVVYDGAGERARTDMNITATWQRFSVPATTVAASYNEGDAIQLRHTSLNSNPVTFYAAFLQFEDATGRADTTTPSEYCPTDLPIGAELFLDVFAATGVGWTDHGDGTASSDGSQVSLSTLRLFTSSLPQLHASFTVSNYSAGAVRPRSGGGSNGTWVSANGSYEEIISIGTVFDFQSDVDFIGTLSNISIKRPSVGYKVFANANGNTVASNVVTEAVGDPLVELPWYSACPAASNALLYGRDISRWGSSGGGDDCPATQNQIGVDGVPNTATLLSDSTNSSEYRFLLLPVSADTNWHTLKIRIRKNTETAYFAYVAMEYSGIAAGCGLHLNTSTGAVAREPGKTGGEYLDPVLVGDFWEMSLSIQNDGARTQLYFFLAPARTTSFGGAHEGATTGSNIFDGAEWHQNTRVSEVRGLSFIPTAGAAVSTTADDLSYDILNHSQTEGGYYFEYRPSAATSEISGDHQLLSLNNAVDLSYYDGTNGDAESTDGTNTATQAQALVAGTAYKIGIAYGDSELRVCVDGSWGTAATYDGAFPYGSALELFNAITHSGEMRDLHRYDLGYVAAQAQIDALMV